MEKENSSYTKSNDIYTKENISKSIAKSIFKGDLKSAKKNILRLFSVTDIVENIDYEYIEKEIFENNLFGSFYYIEFHDYLENKNILESLEKQYQKEINKKLPCNCCTKNQLLKVSYINQLLNVTKYLNGDWKEDFTKESQLKWIIVVNNDNIEYQTTSTIRNSIAYFMSEDKAKDAVKILGENKIKMIFSNY